MILDADVDDIEWLLGPDGGRLIDEAACGPETGLARLTALRKSLSATRASIVIEQAELRRKAREKFSGAERMFFTPLGLEQATDEVIARYKAGRFGSGRNVADLCCGIGGDLLGLVSRGPAVGVERHPVVARIAEVNTGASVRTADAEAIVMSEFDAWHIDPDRRPSGGRTTHVDMHEPGPQVIEAMLRASPNGAIKLAPAGDVPPDWAQASQREWITCRRECRQQVLWFGDLAEAPGTRRATVLVADQPPGSVVGMADVAFDAAGRVCRFVYVPDSAVIAAHLVGELARQFKLASIDGQTEWLTADSCTQNVLWGTFEVVDVLPFDRRRLRAWFREHGVSRLEIKTRAVNVSIEQLRRELVSTGDNEATLLITPLFGQTIAVVARRVTNPATSQGMT
jgi:hypothetical protein